MKKENGFTLIELLAVIVVISIILLLAAPKIGDIIEDARKNTFVEEAKNVFKMAQLKIVDGYENNYISSDDETRLHLSGNELSYCIRINTDGDITHIVVSNGKYYIEGDSNFKKVTTSSVVENSNYVVTCN